MVFQDFEEALIGTMLSVLVLTTSYIIGIVVLTLYEARNYKRNMRRLSEFQREFIFTPQTYDRASAASVTNYQTPRNSRIGKTIVSYLLYRAPKII